MRLPSLTPLLTRAAFFVTFATCAAAHAAPVSWTEVIARLDETSPALAEARFRLAEAEAALAASKALPDPTVFAEGQNLKSGGEHETEQTFGIQQSFSFLWLQRPKTAARKLAYKAEQAAYEETRRELVVRVISLASLYRSLEQQGTLLDTVLSTARQVQQAANARSREGDISDYDAKRLHAELIQLQLRRTRLASERNRTAAELLARAGVSPDTLLHLEPPRLPALPLADAEESARQAVANRLSVQSKHTLAEAGRRAYAAAKLNSWPDFSVGIGRKTVGAEISGLLWRAELEIPISGQRRSERMLARAEWRRADAEYQATLRQAEQEARAAFAEWSALQSALVPSESFDIEDAELSLRRGVQLHLNGEFSSAELVDALRSSLDALAAHLDLQTALLTASLELRRVTGLNILE